MPEKILDAVVVGNVGVDTNVYFHGAEVDFGREANFTENLDCVGQAGGYACRGYAQLGKRTAFIGYVGDDFNGHFIRDELARDGVDTTAVFIDPGRNEPQHQLHVSGWPPQEFLRWQEPYAATA